MTYKVEDVVWILENKDQYDSGGEGYGMFEYTLKSQTSNGLWNAHPTGFYVDDAGKIPLLEEGIEPTRIVRLVRPQEWIIHLGDIVLGWKVVNEPPGAWWIGRVVRFEWKGLYKGEEDNICVVQWLKVDSWERDQNKWEKLRPSCLLPFPEQLHSYVKDLIDAQ
eukprot:CAMPEP_0174304702 /NCGR_PEP_ID=MMETSP0809-20121228/60942_1 /TAXON_ID=73025 ORGANISM="Eutreptiella gymnastica-like, Strain CCMP1594" /NCGR_SAMPLE_ID=MMETSP0809 /ASSEMBLY_ACC=CAM_ASM_000658 /LENGTH=163 /DNA_ID=CAMNT_0015410983 /DNA_START=57 /DNA_END=548 /DNA_ORIENTATION=-